MVRRPPEARRTENSPGEPTTGTGAPFAPLSALGRHSSVVAAAVASARHVVASSARSCRTARTEKPCPG